MLYIVCTDEQLQGLRNKLLQPMVTIIFGSGVLHKDGPHNLLVIARNACMWIQVGFLHI